MTYPITAGLLEFCVLAILRRADEYGYSLTQALQEQIELSESTLYPVLRRLLKAELLETYDQPFQGRNRRYYRLSAQGLIELDNYHKAWQEHKKIIESLVDVPPSNQ